MVIKCKTIFLSDVHLGSLGCKADYLLEFLDRYEADRYYLVGDIIDGWRIRSKFYWPESHSKVIKKILDLSTQGKKIIWILGNHDEFLRPYLEYGLSFGNIEVLNEDEYVTAKGLKLWIVHGDGFDIVIRNAKWLGFLGDRGYVFLIWVNNHFNRFRNCLGFKYWSLSNYVKTKTKQIVKFMAEYSKLVSSECKDGGYDGVICGHIHNSEIDTLDGILYCNTGDWVESCTAIIEKSDGELELVQYMKIAHN